MKYKLYSAGVMVFVLVTVAAIYFLFGSSVMPSRDEAERPKAGEVYEMDKEILEFEHGDPS